MGPGHPNSDATRTDWKPPGGPEGGRIPRKLCGKSDEPLLRQRYNKFVPLPGSHLKLFIFFGGVVKYGVESEHPFEILQSWRFGPTCRPVLVPSPVSWNSMAGKGMWRHPNLDMCHCQKPYLLGAQDGVGASFCSTMKRIMAYWSSEHGTCGSCQSKEFLMCVTYRRLALKSGSPIESEPQARIESAMNA